MLILAFPTILTIFFFDSALQIVDEALESAAEAKKKTSETVDEAFREAIKALKRYEKKYHRDCERKVGERMEAAKKRDINFQSIWDTITCTVKEMFSPKVSLGRIQLLYLILIMGSRLPGLVDNQSQDQPKSSNSICISPFLPGVQLS